jgi:hypothetical protein
MKFYASVRAGKTVDFKRAASFWEADFTSDVSGKLRKGLVKI